MTATRDTIYEAFHTWFIRWAVATGTAPLATSKCIPANENAGLRPTVPFGTVFLAQHGQPVVHDERVDFDDAGTPSYRLQGERRGVAQVHVYGDGSEEWLENLTWSLKDPVQQQVIGDLGLTIHAPLGPIRSLPRQMNANHEPHFVSEFPYSYRGTSGTIAATVAETAEVTGDLYETPSDSATLAVNVTVDLT